nr:hypothetical protein [Pseudomonas sp.]
MYRHIDCALLAVPVFEAWLGNTFTLFAGAETVRPHRFDLRNGAWAGCTAAQAVYDDAASQALLRAAPALARFDVCLLPVMPASLAWTRVALACAHGALPVPLVVLACGLSAPALRDLLRLGAAEFIPESAAADELRLRLMRCATGRKPLPAGVPVLAEPGRVPAMPTGLPAKACAGRPPPPAEAFDLALRQLCAPEPTHDSFRETRAQVMADFERDYVTSMLMRYRGNVTHAARAGNQDRRAFWQLMRKYSILSADFRSS